MGHENMVITTKKEAPKGGTPEPYISAFTEIPEIILKVLNEDSSSWIHLMDHDRIRIAKAIAEALGTMGAKSPAIKSEAQQKGERGNGIRRPYGRRDSKPIN